MHHRSTPQNTFDIKVEGNRGGFIYITYPAMSYWASEGEATTFSTGVPARQEGVGEGEKEGENKGKGKIRGRGGLGGQRPYGSVMPGFLGEDVLPRVGMLAGGRSLEGGMPNKGSNLVQEGSETEAPQDNSGGAMDETRGPGGG